jgi:DNA primase
MSERMKLPGYEEQCRYDFTDEKGALLFQKVRFKAVDERAKRPKDFRYADATNFPRKPAIADSIIYNLPDVLAAVGADQTVHWSEGEADADALTALGYAATSHHQGAGHVTPEQTSWLSGAERVVLWADRDIPGAYDVWRRWQLLLAAGVPEEGIVIVVARTGKDTRDHLNAGHTVAEAVPVNKATITELAAQYTAASARKAGYRAV